MEDNEVFLYRRQFLLGPEPAPYRHWNSFKLSGFYLSTHPDLNCLHVTSGKISITLLGYLLNPYGVEDENSDILEDLLNHISSKDQFLEKINKYGGRWIFIYQDDKDFIILHDTGGVRQIYYTNDADLWCGSQPEIIAANTTSRKNTSAFENLTAVGAFEPWANHFWPGEASLYSNINRLLPNHYLDLKHRKVWRYWPKKSKENISFQQGVDECSFLLKNLILAAGNRFQLAQSITAGWDSRLILSASKDLFPKIAYYTYKRLNLNRFSPDITIPKKILKKYHQKTIEIKVKKDIEDNFGSIFRKNTSVYHENVLLEAHALIQFKREKRMDFVTINGNLGETGRCLYYNPLEKVDVTPEKLASLVNMAGSEYAVDQFSKWLGTALPVAEELNYHILDLFHLEQKIGGWFAALRTEYDIAEEVFSPLNCRVLLNTMLKVDGANRIKKHPKLFKEIIRTLWPELLRFPINPPDRVLLLKKFCKEKLIRPIAVKTKLMPLLVNLKK